MIPILIDGWSTNWKVLKLLEEKYNDREYALLMNIGSCDLHTGHSAFQTGSDTTWNLGKIMKAIGQVFHDSPAIDVYTKICETEEYPLK